MSFEGNDPFIIDSPNAKFTSYDRCFAPRLIVSRLVYTMNQHLNSFLHRTTTSLDDYSPLESSHTTYSICFELLRMIQLESVAMHGTWASSKSMSLYL